MKKIFVLFLAILAMACFSVPVFAADWTTFESATGVKLSANVSAAYAAGTDGVSYAAVTHNPKGMIRSYGTASDTTYIYYATSNQVSGWSGTDSGAFTSDTWTQIGKE